MSGILSYKPRYNLRPIEDIDVGDFDGASNGGGGIITSAIAGSNIAAPPTFNYDLSKINQAIARGNKQSDIESAYQTFLTGIATGKGGQYAADAQRKYGYTSIRDAAAGYLDAAGLPRLAQAVSDTPTTNSGVTLEQLQQQTNTLQETITKQIEDIKKTIQDRSTNDGSPLEQLIDVLPGLFGQSVYNPPLQSQVYGYTPETISSDSGSTSGGIGMWLLLAAVAVVAYLLYKKFAS